MNYVDMFEGKERDKYMCGGGDPRGLEPLETRNLGLLTPHPPPWKITLRSPWTHGVNLKNIFEVSGDGNFSGFSFNV